MTATRLLMAKTGMVTTEILFHCLLMKISNIWQVSCQVYRRITILRAHITKARRQPHMGSLLFIWQLALDTKAGLVALVGLAALIPLQDSWATAHYLTHPAV